MVSVKYDRLFDLKLPSTWKLDTSPGPNLLCSLGQKVNWPLIDIDEVLLCMVVGYGTDKPVKSVGDPARSGLHLKCGGRIVRDLVAHSLQLRVSRESLEASQ